MEYASASIYHRSLVYILYRIYTVAPDTERPRCIITDSRDITVPVAKHVFRFRFHIFNINSNVLYMIRMTSIVEQRYTSLLEKQVYMTKHSSGYIHTPGR